MLIRPAASTDIPALIVLDRSSVTAAHWSRKQYEQAIGEVEPRRIISVSEEGGEVHGFLAALQIAQEWEIENLIVARAEQRHGLAAQLINSFLDGVRRENTAAVFLEVRESNLAARSLYEKVGFAVAGRRKSYYREPEEDALIYRLDLSANLLGL